MLTDIILSITAQYKTIVKTFIVKAFCLKKRKKEIDDKNPPIV
jgi:hypothetical protein